MADTGEKKNNSKGILFIIFSALALVGGGAYLWHLSSAGQMPSLSIQRYGDGGYMFKIDDKPFLVKGFCYNPIPVGKDFEYDFWADPGKPWLTDGKLMKEAGVNAVRIYRTGKHPNLTKQGISDLYTKFGIRTFVGHYLGFWDWPPANYANGAYQKKMTEDVLTMVRTYKDEPGIIGWILGNENNYSFDRNLRNFSTDEIDKLGDPEKMWEARARIYYRFVNDIAVEIRKIDTSRPIVMGLGEIKSLHFAAQETPNVDVLGVIAYRGASFGNLFRQIQQTYDKPVLMIEFGADRFNAYTREEDQMSQSRFVELQWKDIERNSVVKTGSGNAIGGLVFEWSDEWWKGNEALAHTWSIHDQSAQWSHSAYYYDYEAPGRMNINEEWWGVVSLTPRPEEMQNGVDKRTTTRAYDVLKSLWTKGQISVVTDTGAKELKVTAPSALTVPSSEAAKITIPAATPAPEPAPAPITLKTAASSETLPAAASSVPASGLVLVPNTAGGYTWSLNGEPFWAKGVAYSSSPSGSSNPAGAGSADSSNAVSFWSNPDRPWLKDAVLIKGAGANSVRFYADGSDIEGSVSAAQDFYSQGIYTFLGHDLGFWSQPLADYRDEAVRSTITKSVLEMVEAGKNEAGILGWILGNENNVPFEGGVSPDKTAQAEAYFSFVNELAEKIKAIDPARPVIMGVSETQYLEQIAKLTPDVDVIGLISYRGEGFEGLLGDYAKKTAKPVIALQYGADSYNAAANAPDEAAQATYLRSLWTDLRQNTTMEKASGAALGGFLYEWVDQWWRADVNQPSTWRMQDTTAQWSSASYKYDYAAPSNLNVNEEWFGLNKWVSNPANPSQFNMVPKQALAGLTPLLRKPGMLSPETLGFRIEGPSTAPRAAAAIPMAAPSNAVHSPLIKIVRNAAGGANLAAGGEAVWVRGVVYEPTPIGQGPVYDYLADTTSPWNNDGKLMAEAGINSVITHVSANNIPGAQSVADDLLKNYKIWTFAALDPALWTSGSAPDYADPATRERITANVLASVKGLEGSDGVAAWIISNPQGFLKGDEPMSQSFWESYYGFLNELTQKIKAEDPSRPVVVEVAGTDKFKWVSGLLPDADAIGVYGKDGAWGWKKTFDQIRKDVNKPVLVLAYGADSYDMSASKADEDAQAWMIESQWRALDPQTTRLNDAGQALGGFVYEWSDSWWAADPASPSTWTVQDTSAQSSSAAYPADFVSADQMNVNEEWFGIMKLRPAAPGTAAPVLAPKKVYETLRQMWTGPSDVCLGKS
ncbi:MAG: hypothetical protein KBD07_02090 [Candidatus Omnitrophica bacterium]|nr:hypothetical protein [Candidatus Omnitrophota bacterium]